MNAVDADAELARLVERARALMRELDPDELSAMVRTADGLLDQWQRWFELMRRDREGAA